MNPALKNSLIILIKREAEPVPRAELSEEIFARNISEAMQNILSHHIIHSSFTFIWFINDTCPYWFQRWQGRSYMKI